MYLIFDTSAVGMPKKWTLPETEIYNWPRMVHIAWEYYGEDRKLLESHDFIIKPEGFEITKKSANINGISKELAATEGKTLNEALDAFATVVEKANIIISHNLNFNEKVVGAEFHRKALDHTLFYSEKYCLMQEATYFCKLPSKKGGYKWPTLSELFFKLFGAKYEGANNARADVLATSASFFRMMDLGQLDDLLD